MIEFPGVNVAAVTPRGKQGEVDLGATFELIDYLCAAGAGGIVLFGDVGEYPAFTIDERSRLVYLAVKRSRVPILVGVGSATLDFSLALAGEARNAGAASALLPPPWFYRYEPDEVREFYLEFARHAPAGLPVLLSNTPEVTSAIPPATAIDLLDSGHFAGIEDASGDLESFAWLRAEAARSAGQVLVGSDALFTRARCADRGRAGAISRAACAVPELLVALDRGIGRASPDRIARLDEALQEFLAWEARFPRPVALKVATGLRGLKTGPSAAPLSPAKQTLLDEFREWFQSWLPGVKKLSADA